MLCLISPLPGTRYPLENLLLPSIKCLAELDVQVPGTGYLRPARTKASGVGNST